MNDLSTPWDDIPAETTDTLPPSVMSDRIEYVESQIQVPFIRGVGAVLNRALGAGLFDWGALHADIKQNSYILCKPCTTYLPYRQLRL